MLPAVVRADDEDDPELALGIPEDREEHRRRPQSDAHGTSCARRSATVSRARITLAEPSRTRTAAGLGTPL